MFEVQQNFSYIEGLECLILNADKKKQSNPNKKGADLRNLMQLQNGFEYFVLHRAHSRVKSRGQGGCDMLWPEISTEMHKSVKSCFELVAPYDLTSCVYTLQNVAKALLKMHLDF